MTWETRPIPCDEDQDADWVADREVHRLFESGHFDAPEENVPE